MTPGEIGELSAKLERAKKLTQQIRAQRARIDRIKDAGLIQLFQRGEHVGMLVNDFGAWPQCAEFPSEAVADVIRYTRHVLGLSLSSELKRMEDELASL